MNVRAQSLRVMDLWQRSGSALALVRLPGRSLRRLLTFCNTAMWRLSLNALGSRCRIALGVGIERPRMVSIGDGCAIATGVQMSSETSSGRLEMADGVQINTDVHLDYSGSLTLGQDALISSGVMIYTHHHGYDPRSAPQLTPLRIGPRAWVGARAIVMAGVGEIGAGSIVAAGAVVTKRVPPSTVVAGNPARPIRVLETDG